MSQNIVLAQRCLKRFDVCQPTKRKRFQLHHVVLSLPEVVEQPPWPGQGGVEHISLEQGIEREADMRLLQVFWKVSDSSVGASLGVNVGRYLSRVVFLASDACVLVGLFHLAFPLLPPQTFPRTASYYAFLHWKLLALPRNLGFLQRLLVLLQLLLVVINEHFEGQAGRFLIWLVALRLGLGSLDVSVDAAALHVRNVRI